jgi:hypothetical protein
MANLAVPPVLPSKGLGAAGVLYGLDNLNPSIANAIRVDATGALVVTTVGGAVPAGAAKTTTTAYYTATAPGPGFATGDILRETQIIDPATGAVTSSIWTNMDTGVTLTTPPNMGSLAFQPNEPLTNTELRSAPLQVTDTPVYDELVTMNTKFDTLLGNTDQIETIQTTTNSLITNLITYNDQVETLLGTINTNVDGLEPLIDLLNTYNDEVEPLLTQISGQLPTTIGAKPSLQSLSVTLASDQVMPLPTGAATEAKQDVQITQLTTLIDGVGKDETLEEIRDLVATEATLAALEAKAATESSLVNLITHFPPDIGPYPPSQSLSVYVSNASDIGGGGAASSGGNNVVLYTATAVSPDVAVGDLVQQIQTIDSTTTPPTITDAWYNLTTGTFLTAAPPAADLALAGGGSSSSTLPVSRDIVVQRAAGTSVTTPADLKEVSLAVESGYILIQGEWFTAGYSLAFTSASDNETLNPITIDATNGSVLITIIQ